MPLDLFPDSFIDTANARFEDESPDALLRYVFDDAAFGKTALVSSFGAQSVVLLHMVAQIAPDTPVIFVDTQMLFEETLAYQRDLAKTLGLTNLHIVQPDRQAIFEHDNEGLLHLHNPDACCALRKTAPLMQALKGYDSWITGRKRYQSSTRDTLPLFETEDGVNRIKINPLAGWSVDELAAYMDTHDLPRHPLVARGFRSIGCAPCTTQTTTGEDDRAGRWRDQDKTECGIHFANGKAQRPIHEAQ